MASLRPSGGIRKIIALFRNPVFASIVCCYCCCYFFLLSNVYFAAMRAEIGFQLLFMLKLVCSQQIISSHLPSPAFSSLCAILLHNPFFTSLPNRVASCSAALESVRWL